MDELTLRDLESIRQGREENDATTVMNRAAMVRAYLQPNDKGHAEATRHLAWAFGELGRDDDAVTLYKELIGRKFAIPTAEHMHVLCDYALLSARRGNYTITQELLRTALALGVESEDPELQEIATNAAVKIAAELAT